MLTGLMFIQLLYIPPAYALTSGPTQPEVQSFQPAGTTDMVDLFTGDFSYNIPLFELPGPNGGYPFNLSYQAGIGMDQEASWVGLGFNLNPGAITRQMRGLPDEFNGDPVHTKMAIDPSVTVGLGAGASVEVFGGDPSLGIGFSVSQNNYKGMGYSIDASLGFERSVSSGMTGGVGLDISLDAKEGIGVSPSLSLGGKMGQFGLRGGYHSRQGFHKVSLSHSFNYGMTRNMRVIKTGKHSKNSVSSSLSLAHPGYTPQVSMPMRNLNIAATFKAGGAWWGVFGSPYVRGFYNEQRLKNNKKRVRTGAYGYLHYQNADNSSLMDFNREKDGMVSKESPNLPIPSLTYDIYSVTGQGMMAMYRPLRNDFGVVYDPETTSKSVGVAAGADVGPAASHVGVNLDINHSNSTSGVWDDNNQVANRATFQQKNLGDVYEPWYFKVHGEPSADDRRVIDQLGGDQAVRVRLTGSRSDPVASNTLENRRWNGTAPASTASNRERKLRGTVVQPITNDELLNGSSEMISHFKVNYLDPTGVERAFNRSALPGHHMAGYTALSQDGLRYNYAIPAYNLKQEEVTFSVRKQPGQVARVNVGNPGQNDPDYDHNGTEKFLKKVEMPSYAHSFLLTSILGPDYVDVTGDGVSADDLGYWVKFTYQKTTGNTPYKWRDPFSQAHFQQGWKTDPRDDKGSFVYGEKELWYLSKAETKSHIALFTLQARDDGKGVNQKQQDTNVTGEAVSALANIQLFTRSAGTAHPIKRVRFEYDYSLCPGIYNNSAGTGKLTLKKLWFEYGNSQRGQLNPYVFSYGHNPSYDVYAYDRWGNYKPYPAGDFEANRDFPYTAQDPSRKQDLDLQAAAWSLNEIQLPSGGKVQVDYEIDDYGYVQHKTAMQMTSIVDPYSSPTAAGNSKVLLKRNDLKMRFKLESPIAGNLASNVQREEVLKYLDTDREQLYFKALVNLRTPSENFHEYISGYADIDFSRPMGLEKDGTGNYVYGYFYLVQEDGNHPISRRTWQHLRTNQPELTSSGRRLRQTNSTSERINQIKSLAGVGAQVRQIFEGFFNYCYNKNWGREIVLDKSWIRLKSPDKIKYGGGLRVRQVTMTDGWAEDEEGVYGQIYEYTQEEGGQQISSGVAAYEPMIGGEENALRYAKKYVQAVPLRSDNNLFFEYPVNETYFPGPQVGYSRVTVTSLAAAHLAGKPVKNIILSDGNPLFPQGSDVSYGTSGQTVHEFYTAKDFPVLADETEKANKPYKLSVLIPFLGNVSISKLSASQGYSVVTNDMHGKQKKVSNYRQDREGNFEPGPISWVRYNYAQQERIYQKESVFSVNNVFKDNRDGTVSLASASDLANSGITKYVMGQETEFFMDMRKSRDDTWGGGARLNVDIVYIPLLFVVIPIPIPTVWPNISKSTTELRTVSTNKVIFKAGVLESVEAYDGGSLVKTENLKWDKISGQPVLTVVNNNFNEPLYSYNIPAYHQYQGMGAAYQNAGLTFVVNNVQPVLYKNDLYTFTSTAIGAGLYPGDEIILYPAAGDVTGPVAKAVYIGEEDGDPLLYSQSPLPGTEFTCRVARSGYRNQLMVTASSITALEDPSVKGSTQVFTKSITIPKGK